jgi:hypothetical protein
MLYDLRGGRDELRQAPGHAVDQGKQDVRPSLDHARQHGGNLRHAVRDHGGQFREQVADLHEQLPAHALVEHAQSRDQGGDDGADAEELQEVARAEEAAEHAADLAEACLHLRSHDVAQTAEYVAQTG